jgi:hypothetical protein
VENSGMKWRKRYAESITIRYVCHFSPYSTIFHFYNGGQILLVEQRTQMHMQCIWEETTDLPQVN